MSLIVRNIENLRSIFLQGVKSVQPSTLFAEFKLSEIAELNLQNRNYKYHIVGFGKAVLGMAVQMERILANKCGGIISIPIGTIEKFASIPNMMLSENSAVKIYEGAENNLPDAKAMSAATIIKGLAESMNSTDILFVLISGGGSALLPLPKEPLTLENKLNIIRKLSNQGIGISDLNIVRIALSAIKGGKLAKAAKNAGKIVSLIISDIVNDPIDLIASGPTVEFDMKSKKTAKDILQQYNMWDDLEASVRKVILAQDSEEQIELKNNYIYVIGNNKIAAQACYNEAINLGYLPVILSTTIQGNVIEISKNYIKFLKNLNQFRNGMLNKENFLKEFPFDNNQCFKDFCSSVQNNISQPILLILAGEPTVIVKGNGIGGRNQELALRMSLEFYLNTDLENINFLSAGTDGIDGPTIAAGALGSVSVVNDFLKDDHSLEELKIYLDNNDSFSFYNQLENGKYHVLTGHTGTNVMDLHLFVIP